MRSREEQGAEAGMKVLLASDGSEHSLAAIRLLNRFPFGTPPEVFLLSIVDTSRWTQNIDLDEEAFAALQATLREEAERRLASEAQLLEHRLWKVHLLVRHGHAGEQIVEAAEKADADLVVVGSRGLGGLARYLLGSVSDNVLQHAGSPVLLARPEREAAEPARKQEPSLRIVLGLDGSASARAAEAWLTRSGLVLGSRLLVLRCLAVVTSFHMDVVQRVSKAWLEEKREARAELEKTRRRLSETAGEVSTRLSEVEDESSEIMGVAEEWGADLIVLGHKGRSAIERFVMGSVSSKVAHHADCSVLVVKTRE